MLITERDYRLRLEHIEKTQGLKEVHPACARKLVEGAEAYALDLGFYPHGDYGVAKKIFGDIDKELCPRSFTFGREGC